VRSKPYVQLIALALVAVTCAALAPTASADTPESISYQGVLRDAGGNPMNGSFNMTFRFFDSPSGGGNEILIDAQLVDVADGLFVALLGSGAVSDGSADLPGDPHTTLAAVFADFPAVWLQIEIGAEVLDPRVEISAVPYAHHAQSAVTALNAGTLGGLVPGSFLDTSATAQTKTGGLRVNGTLTAGADSLSFNSPGAREGMRPERSPSGTMSWRPATSCASAPQERG